MTRGSPRILPGSTLLSFLEPAAQLRARTIVQVRAASCEDGARTIVLAGGAQLRGWGSNTRTIVLFPSGSRAQLPDDSRTITRHARRVPSPIPRTIPPAGRKKGPERQPEAPITRTKPRFPAPRSLSPRENGVICPNMGLFAIFYYLNHIF